MKFNTNDIVMAHDNGKLYEAKVLKGHNLASTWKYFIHFQGWNRKYDVWVDEKAIALKSDQKQIAKLQESLCVGSSKSATAKKNESGAKRSTRAVDAETETVVSATAETVSTVEGTEKAGTKRKVPDEADAAAIAMRKRIKLLATEDLVENEKEEQEKFYPKLTIPYNLKKHLIDEWTLVTKDPKRLVKLPRAMTVENIVQEFLDERIAKFQKDKDTEEAAKYQDMFELMQYHFDRALPTILLYRHEREQYDAVMAAAESAVDSSDPQALSLRPSQIYGGEHLLRLFVRMPRLLTNVFMAEKDLAQIMAKFVDFLKFLSKNKKFVDISEYAPVEEAMTRIAEWKDELKKAATEGGPKTRHLATRRK